MIDVNAEVERWVGTIREELARAEADTSEWALDVEDMAAFFKAFPPVVIDGKPDITACLAWVSGRWGLYPDELREAAERLGDSD